MAMRWLGDNNVTDPNQKRPKDDPIAHDRLENDWEKESCRTINESKLRGEPEWVEEIGDENENPQRTEQNLQDYGWDLVGEDDFVSDPTGEADSPTWLDDDYEDDYPEHLKHQRDRLARGDAQNEDDSD